MLQPIEPIEPGANISFYYTNHRGERALRNVALVRLECGSNDWHPSQTLFLRCWDFSRRAERSFDAARIEDVQLYWREERP